MTMQPTTDAGGMRPASHKLIASDRIEGTSVRRPDGQRIGSIKRLMIDKISGQVAYAVLNFGGFFGIGQSHYPIPWSRLKYDPLAAAYEVDLSEQELKHASEHGADEDFDWGDRHDDIAIQGFQRKPTYWGMY
jgi:hypothetical protein